MHIKKMTVREFIAMDIDNIDVYDDVEDEIGVAFYGPLELTKEGKEHFSEVLNYEIVILVPPGHPSCAMVLTDRNDGDKWKHRSRKAKEFFYAAAGCYAEKYYSWFKE